MAASSVVLSASALAPGNTHRHAKARVIYKEAEFLSLSLDVVSFQHHSAAAHCSLLVVFSYCQSAISPIVMSNNNIGHDSLSHHLHLGL